MDAHDLSHWQHSHLFGSDHMQQAEQRTRWVILLTFITMLVELVTGHLTGSMALTADGWHMGTHVAALGLSAFAYAFARRQAHNPRFTFGTGKVGALGAFASAIALALAALMMALESLERLLNPVPVRFQEAMAVALAGLLVNLASAWLLGGDHHHGHDHGLAPGHGHDHDHGHDHPHGHDHDHGHDHAPATPHPAAAARQEERTHQDHNLRAAYFHVLADALTSLTAIVALTCGMWLGWVWMDPLMGVLGSLVIALWAKGLLRDSGRVLLDAEETGPRQAEIRDALGKVPDCQIADLHVWRVGPASHACIVSLVTHTPRPLSQFKAPLEALRGLDHVTVEVNMCRECTPPGR